MCNVLTILVIQYSEADTVGTTAVCP